MKTAQVAGESGLFSAAVADNLNAIAEFGTKDIDDFMCDPNGTNPMSLAAKAGSEDDLLMLCYLVDNLIERAAKLTAINLSSVSLKNGKGQNPLRPICIVAEGTTFYHLKSLKSRTEYYLKQYLEDQKHIYVEITSVENATLIGAAIAGLTN